VKRFTIIRLLALPLLAAAFWPSTGALARPTGAPSQATPALGPLTIRPKQVRVGQLLTISGRTTAFVQFLPPFITVQSTHKHRVDRGPGPCGGTQSEPIASFTKPGGGSGGPGTRQHPPSGTHWQVRFRIPAHMDSSTIDGRPITIPTPPGTYTIVATGLGLDFCTLPTTSTAQFSVGRLHIVP
jgi:hypothetical protein